MLVVLANLMAGMISGCRWPSSSRIHLGIPGLKWYEQEF